MPSPPTRRCCSNWPTPCPARDARRALGHRAPGHRRAAGRGAAREWLLTFAEDIKRGHGVLRRGCGLAARPDRAGGAIDGERRSQNTLEPHRRLSPRRGLRNGRDHPLPSLAVMAGRADQGVRRLRGGRRGRRRMARTVGQKIAGPLGQPGGGGEQARRGPNIAIKAAIDSPADG